MNEVFAVLCGDEDIRVGTAWCDFSPSVPRAVKYPDVRVVGLFRLELLRDLAGCLVDFVRAAGLVGDLVEEFG